MIKKINKVRNLGKYTKLDASQSEFFKFTIIEGENCNGKTTMTDIFKSLQGDESVNLEKRKTIPNSNGDIEVVISIYDKDKNKEENYIYNLKNNTYSWNKKYSNIITFDTEFINNNVIRGFNIERENKENFTKFILGESSIKIAEKIESTFKEISEINTNIKGLNIVGTEGLNEVALKEYCSLDIKETKEELISEKSETDAKIKENNKEINDLDKRQNIKLRTEIIYTSTHFQETLDEIDNILNSNVEDVVSDIIREFKTTQQTNHTQDKEQWIKEGYEIAKNTMICPFCSNDLNQSKSTIQIYSQYFSNGLEKLYNQVNYYLNNQLVYVDDFLYIRALEENNNIYINEKKYDIHLSYINDLLFKLENLHKLIKEQKERIETKVNTFKVAIDEKLKQKLTSINSSISIKDIKSELCNEIIIQEKNINEYNQIVQEINKIIRIKKEKAQEDKETIKKQIEELINYNKNLDYKINRKLNDEKCELYLKYLLEKDTKINERELYIQELQQEEKQYVEIYFNKINQYYKQLGARDFEIFKKDKKAGKLVTYELEIKFKNQNININDLKYCMSESDKRALGLAIFLAKLDNLEEEQLSNMVIVLDDPFTSFDDNRISSSLSIVKDLYRRSNQLVIITHYKEYIKMLLLRLSDIEHIVTYRIEHNKDNSEFIKVPKENYIDDNYIKEIKRAYAFINNEIENYDIGKIRIILEEYINIRFLSFFIVEKISLKEDFSKKLLALKEKGVITEEEYTKYDDIRKMFNPDHHIINIDTSESDKVTIVEKFLKTL